VIHRCRSPYQRAEVGLEGCSSSFLPAKSLFFPASVLVPPCTFPRPLALPSPFFLFPRAPPHSRHASPVPWLLLNHRVNVHPGACRCLMRGPLAFPCLIFSSHAPLLFLSESFRNLRPCTFSILSYRSQDPFHPRHCSPQTPPQNTRKCTGQSAPFFLKGPLFFRSTQA